MNPPQPTRLALASSPRLRITVNIALVLLLAGTTVLVFWPFRRAADDMTAFCASVRSGMTVGEMRSRAAAQGYEVDITSSPGKLRITDPRLSADRACELALASPP
jgi:hypothetical protein